MYSSDPKSSHDKYGALAPAPAPAAAYPSTGIPLTSSNQYQSGSYGSQPPHPVPWSTGINDCFSDVKSCILTLFCPCVTFGRIAEIVDKGSTSCGASGALYALILFVTGGNCACMYSCFYRSKMRQQFALEESPCGDCLVHCCCEYCALCQEYRELQNRGFNLELGWQGNVEERNREAAKAPIVEGGMTR